MESTSCENTKQNDYHSSLNVAGVSSTDWDWLTDRALISSHIRKIP